MGMIDRMKNIMIAPRTEWDVIAAEPTPPRQVVLGYVLPLVVIAALAGFVSGSLIGTSSFLGGTFRMPILWGLVLFVYQLLAGVLGVFVLAFIVDALAPTFGGQKDFRQAIKLVAYSYTSATVAAVLGILPWLGLLFALAFGLYCIYLLYLGLPKLMRNPPEKSVAYTVVIIVVAIVVFAIIGFISTLIMAPALIGSASMTGHRMEAAEKSGDSKKHAQAAMGVLGAALSGGKGVEPVQLDALKPMLPATFAGLPQTATKSERSGVTGLMVAKAGATYRDASGKRVELQVVDTGGAAGLVGLATWIGVQGEREDDKRREVTRKEGKRLVHEEVSKTGGRNKYAVVLADRFVVSADGKGVDLGTLKSAVGSLDLAKLEAMK